MVETRRLAGSRATGASRSSTSPSSPTGSWPPPSAAFGFTPGVARAWCPPAPRWRGPGATVWLGALLFGRRAALAGGVVLATTLAFVGFGRVAMSDMLLDAVDDLGGGLRGSFLPRRLVRSGASAVLGAALGLGFLTKGPIALLLPGLALLLACAARAPSPGGALSGRARWPPAWGCSASPGSAGSWPSTRGWAPGPSPTSSCGRTCSASPARPTTSGRPFWYYLADLPRRRPALVAVPSPGASGGWRHEEPEARRSPLPSGLGGADARSPEPVPRQDRLLPAPALSARCRS